MPRVIARSQSMGHINRDWHLAQLTFDSPMRGYPASPAGDGRGGPLKLLTSVAVEVIEGDDELFLNTFEGDSDELTPAIHIPMTDVPLFIAMLQWVTAGPLGKLAIEQEHPELRVREEVGARRSERGS